MHFKDYKFRVLNAGNNIEFSLQYLNQQRLITATLDSLDN